MAQIGLDTGLDRSSDIPLGTQLAWKLRGAIAAGRLRPGDRLPGVRELAAAAGVNVNTVRAVYGRLADQDVIVSEHGRGTFVAQSAVRDDLVRLAERTAREARRSGVDPRELAALLYAGAAGGDAVADRRALHAEIEGLEREYAKLERELSALGEVVAATTTRPVVPERPPEPRILSASRLQRVRDDLAAEVASLRERLAVAQDRARGAERTRGIASTAPERVVSGGSLTLRWPA